MSCEINLVAVLKRKADKKKIKEYLDEDVLGEYDDGTKMTYTECVNEARRTQLYNGQTRLYPHHVSDWLRGLPSGMHHAFEWCKTVKLVEDWTGEKCDWDNQAGDFDDAYWELLGEVIYLSAALDMGVENE